MMSDFKQRATIASAVKLGCLSPEDAAALRAERDSALTQLASLSKHESPLQHDLVFECERAMKQRDEWLRTGISTAGHGGGWDTMFTFIVAKHANINPDALAQHDSEVAARAVDEFVSAWQSQSCAKPKSLCAFRDDYIAQIRAGKEMK